MPSVSEKQHNAMEAAAHGNSTIGIPESVGKEFIAADSTPEVVEVEIKTEYDFAIAIREGILQSPQKYQNCWLFDLRITGTGFSYRLSEDEFVWRDPKEFLNEDFVNRCHGLPVIFEHPERKTLNTQEFLERVVGTIIIPYIKGDEVWGVAKILDENAAHLMMETHKSTSPMVIIDPEKSVLEIIDGKKVLLEGSPIYLDHLAICTEGVWDKLEEPSGVNLGNNNGEENMEPVVEVKEEEKAPDWLANALRPIMERLDAIESKSKEKSDDMDNMPAEEMIADESKNKEEPKKEEEMEPKKMDENEDKYDEEFKKEFKTMSEKVDALTKPLDEKEKDELSSAHAKADSAYSLFGKNAPAPLYGESPISYRMRAAEGLKSHSKNASSIKMSSLEPEAFNAIEKLVYADAQVAATKSIGSAPGHLIEHVTIDAAGRRIKSYTGDIMADNAFGPFMLKPQYGKLKV